jgi:Multicopper oxidase
MQYGRRFRGKTTTRTPRFSQNNGDVSRCGSASLHKLGAPGGGPRIREFRSEFFSVRFEPTRLRLTHFRKFSRDRPETHRFDDHVRRSIPRAPYCVTDEGCGQADRWRDEGCHHAWRVSRVEVDFAADNPGLTLFHCHQQLHIDFG